MRKAFFVLLVTSLLAGCSTVSGVGKDISGAADWTRDKMGGK